MTAPEHPEGAGWRDEELFELDADGRLRDVHATAPAKYTDGSSIDWFAEEALARARTQMLHSQQGIRGFVLPAMDAARMWFVVILTFFEKYGGIYPDAITHGRTIEILLLRAVGHEFCSVRSA